MASGWMSPPGWWPRRGRRWRCRAEPGAHLHLVGEGPQRRLLELQAEQLGISGAVSFHGPVRREKLGAYYRAADVLAVSSRHEAQSVVVLEAALCGLPVVGAAVG